VEPKNNKFYKYIFGSTFSKGGKGNQNNNTLAPPFLKVEKVDFKV